MKDGQYTVREVKVGKKRRNEIILKGVEKTDVVLSDDAKLQKGSIVNVRGRKIVSVKAYT